MAQISLQQALVSSYLPDFRVKKVVGHDHWKYREIFVKYLVLFALISGAAMFFDLFESINQSILIRIYSILVVIIYGVCLYELIDYYLDTLIITDIGLVLFQRHSPFTHTTSVIQRVAIESIEHTRFGFLKSLFNIGGLSIQVEDNRYVFNRIHNPAKTMHLILRAKEKYTTYSMGENIGYKNIPPSPTTPDKETYNLFVEALGEVMEEYLKKKGT